MAIIWLPQATYNNLDATRPRLSAACLKSATAAGKIKESAKVPRRVRLFRLLPANIEGFVALVNRYLMETKTTNAVAESVGTR
jgi:hypothetical protein